MSADGEPLGRHDAINLALDSFGGNAIALEILLACAANATAPVDLARDGRSVGFLAYHFRELHKLRMLRVQRRQRKRGAVKTYYASTAKGEQLLRQLGLPEDASA